MSRIVVSVLAALLFAARASGQHEHHQHQEPKKEEPQHVHHAAPEAPRAELTPPPRDPVAILKADEFDAPPRRRE